MGKSLPETCWADHWRSIKLLLLHLVGFYFYLTYIDDARSNTNQVYTSLAMYTGLTVCADRNFSITEKRQLISELFYIFSCQSIVTCSGHWYTLKHTKLSRSPLLLNLPQAVVQILMFFGFLCCAVNYKTKCIFRRSFLDATKCKTQMNFRNFKI